jgi:Tol biopolymer transport system component
LAVRDLATGSNRLLTNDGSLNEPGQHAEWSAVSPDSKQVAYVWFNKASYELRVVGLEGSAPRTVYHNEEVYYFMAIAWFPDGKRLLATFFRTDGSNQIAMLSLADGTVRVLKTLDWRVPGNMDVSPDGRWIVYDFAQAEGTTYGDIFLLATDGSQEIRLVQHPADDDSPYWAPDGRTILFLSNRTGACGLYAVSVGEGKPLGAAQIVKADLGSNTFPLGITRSGSYYYGGGPRRNDVYDGPLDPVTGKVASTPTPVAQSFVGTNVRPQWSPDGRSLAYISQRGPGPRGSRVLVIHSEETGEQREVIPRIPMSYFGASWSPDGRSFLMATQDFKGRPGFYRVDAETGETSLLAILKTTEYVSFTRYLPDGKTVFYLVRELSSEAPRLVLKDLKTGEEKEVARGPFRPFARPGLALSPDGRQVAFGKPEGKSRSIFVLPINGGEPRLVVRIEDESVASLTWMPDGRALLFTRKTGPEKKTELWRVSIQGGEPDRLGLVMDGMLNMSVHPDGKRIAIGIVEQQPEIWVLENFLPALKAGK